MEVHIEYLFVDLRVLLFLNVIITDYFMIANH